MPNRGGSLDDAGNWNVNTGMQIPVDLVVNSRTGNQPGVYNASSSITFDEGFESEEADTFDAWVVAADGGSGSSGTATAGGYRYGFNGKENDNEVKGEGNQQDYGMRIYDPRLGKFLSEDPLTKEYPWYTPYQFAGNKPIQAIDRDGAEEELVQFGSANRQKIDMQVEIAVTPKNRIFTYTPNWASRIKEWAHSDGIWLSGAKEFTADIYDIADQFTITYNTIVNGKNHAYGLDGTAVTNYKERMGANLNALSNVLLPVIEMKASKVTFHELEELFDQVVTESQRKKYTSKSAMVGGMLPNGVSKIGVTGSMREKIVPILKNTAERDLGPIGTVTPQTGNTIGCCAEFHVADDLLRPYPQYGPKDIRWTDAIRPYGQRIIPMCGNCRTLFQTPMPRATANLWYLNIGVSTLNK
ncbi:RHS repeat-associated core domain-containing protein [Chitinophaga sp. Hz27]|uniref:RHS repeat-associated core domain-containing protein n=1 Tax=Chitinophaga sp. Hz27 TaxID=3347169 RepID=UPI0035D66E40